MSRRTAVIGCGDISRLHFKGLADLGAEVVAVCDTDPTRLAEAVPELDPVRVGDHRELLAMDGLDVVHVTTPHNQHVPVAVDFLEAGIPVLTEKPIAASLAEADRLVETARRTGTKNGVCYQNRYNAQSQAAKEIIESGRYGTVVGASASVLWHRTREYYLDRPWRGSKEGSGGGVLINQAIHTIDMLQWLVGDVTEVTGSAGTYGLGDVIEVEDTATVAMTHGNGVQSILTATNLNRHNAPVTVDIETEGALLTMAQDLTVTLPDGTTETIEGAPRASGPRSYWGNSHGQLIKEFHDQLDDPEPFWIDVAEGYKSLWILKQVLGY